MLKNQVKFWKIFHLLFAGISFDPIEIPVVKRHKGETKLVCQIMGRF
jgi:hypothetical protein